MLEEYFQHNNAQYIIFIAYILTFYLIEQYSRYNFNVEIKHCIIFVLFRTILYINDIFSKQYVHIQYIYTWIWIFLVPGSFVVPAVDHLNMNKTN